MSAKDYLENMHSHEYRSSSIIRSSVSAVFKLKSFNDYCHDYIHKWHFKGFRATTVRFIQCVFSKVSHPLSDTALHAQVGNTQSYFFSQRIAFLRLLHQISRPSSIDFRHGHFTGPRLPEICPCR